MDAEALVSERLELALSSLDLAPSYRNLLLSVGQGYLKAQVQHYRACLPPIQLPFLCCEAHSGHPNRAVGVTTAWFLLQVAAHLLDKVEDHELEMVGPHLRHQGVSTNLSTGLIFVAEWVLNHLEMDSVDAGAAWDVQRAFQETVLSVCSGQHLDLSLASPDLFTCWKIAEAKSGAAFGLACYVGARVATNDTQRLRAMEAFGRHLGTIVQVSDDLKDLELDKEESQNPSSSLIRAFLSQVCQESCERTERNNSDRKDRDLPRNALILYLRLEAMKYAEMAQQELSKIQLCQQPRDHIVAILNHLSWLGVTTN